MNPCPHCHNGTGSFAPDNGTITCPECGQNYDVPWNPLFIITGGGGCGKTTVAQGLAGRVKPCIFTETDFHGRAREVCESNQDFWNYVAIHARALAQSDVPIVICGWIDPVDVHRPHSMIFFSAVHVLILACDETEQRTRLEVRHAKHNKGPINPDKIEMALRATGIMKEQAATVPNTTVLDTTHFARDQTLDAVEHWILDRLPA